MSLNGVLVNDLETGLAPWTWWGGLNDVTRWTETRNGHSHPLQLRRRGRVLEYGLRATDLRRGTRFSYALTEPEL